MNLFVEFCADRIKTKHVKNYIGPTADNCMVASNTGTHSGTLMTIMCPVP